MKHEEMPEFAELLMALSSSYGQTLNEFTIERYWQTLEPFEFDDVKKALYACTMQNPDKGHFMPEASEVLRYIKGSSETQALQAWLRVVDIIKHIGSYDSLVFDDFILHRVIDDMGGWINLCETTIEELKFRSYEFKKLYAAYVLHPPADYPKKLSGRLNWQNSLRGFEAKPAVLIGDKEKAMQVYDGGVDNTTQIHREMLLLEKSNTDENSLELPATSEVEE